MADWTNIADTSLDPDAPLTSQLAFAWRDNPIAIAEGAVGAPKVQAAAVDLLLLTGEGVVTDLDRVNSVLVGASLKVTGGQAGNGDPIYRTVSVQYRLSSNNGSTWTSYTEAAFAAAFGPGETLGGGGSIAVSLDGYNAIQVAYVGSGVIGSYVSAVAGVSP